MSATRSQDDPTLAGASAPSYIMESPEEGARLEKKTDAVTVARQLRLTGLRPHMRALDVGCGTGAVTRVMAGLAAPGSATGIDVSGSRLEEARRLAARGDAAIAFLPGEATDLPLPSASFDYVWSRFLFQYLPDPERALAEMIRVAVPGGTVVVADLDGQIEQFYPLDACAELGLRSALALLAESGFDPRVGRKLFNWFRKAGLQDVTVHCQPYQVYGGGVPESELANWRQKVETVTRRLIAQTGDRDHWEAFRAAFLAQIQHPDTFYYSTLILVQGIVPNT
jgi:ubiquinone/menaquinone biosynthesis C-methylase UbiE